MHAQAIRGDVVAKLVPGGESQLAHLSDGELLAQTRGLVGKSNQVFAALLAHLAEVDARGLHRTRACSSLYTYCIYELRFSEDAAARRSSAAKLVKRFPALLDAIANGELHLTGLLLLAPHLTPENHVDVLARAKFRTKKELSKLVRELHPLPLVPDRIEPVGLERRVRFNPSWHDVVTATSPLVRQLPPGERPRDWANDANDANEWAVSPESAETALARVEATRALELPPITAPQRYQMQFTTTEEHVGLVERAKALLARQAGQSLGELHLRALRLLVTALEKQKFATTKQPRQTAAVPEARDVPETRDDFPGAHDDAPAAPRRRGRHIPAAVRRTVFERDGARCTFVDERGQRCRETHQLEVHHQKPFGKGGPHTAENVTLHCAAHNALAAEADFGREHMEQFTRPRA